MNVILKNNCKNVKDQLICTIEQTKDDTLEIKKSLEELKLSSIEETKLSMQHLLASVETINLLKNKVDVKI